MVLTHPGIKDGMFYFLSDPTSNGIYVFQFICAGLATFIARTNIMYMSFW